MTSVHRRVVFLAGATSGIGLAMTDALLAAGHCVAAVDRDAKALDGLAARHPNAKDRLHLIFANLAHAEGCEGAVAAARARFGAIEAVINNSGIGMSSVRPDAEARAPGH
jgi:NADP-dependent 3-hydroxy acid dehydrogenase YdfG